MSEPARVPYEGWAPIPPEPVSIGRKEPIGSKSRKGGVPTYGSEGRFTTYERGRWEEYDSRPGYAVFVCGRAGFSAEPSRKRRLWRVGQTELSVSLRLDQRVRYVVWVRGGWPDHPAPRSLVLAAVYAITVTGTLRVPRGPALARWQTRALIEAGLIEKPTVGMPTPPDAPPSVHAASTWVDLLLAARAANGEADEPVPLSAPFLQGWSGNAVSESMFVAARKWWARNGYITHAGSIPTGFGKPLNLWKVLTAPRPVSPPNPGTSPAEGETT